MSEETKRRLFDPFFTTKFTGRGLGMAATQGIIRSHKGIILLESEEGEGTTIRILFPVEAIMAITEQEQYSNPSENKPAVSERKRMALIVDDEEIVRSLGVEIVQYLGYEPLEACDGAEALEIYTRHADDIAYIILDMTMPVMDGVTAFHKLKEINPDVHIILSSGYSAQSVDEQFPNEKPDAYMQKPFQIKEMEKIINKVVALFETCV